MKKALIGLSATLALSFSLNTFASELLDSAAQARFEKDVAEMTEYANLSREQAATMMQIKIDLYVSNQKAMAEYGKDSAEFKAERKANMKAFQNSLKTTLTSRQLKAHREHLDAKRKKKQA